VRVTFRSFYLVAIFGNHRDCYWKKKLRETRRGSITTIARFLLYLLRAVKFSPSSDVISHLKRSQVAKCPLEDIRCHYSNNGISDTWADHLYSFARGWLPDVRIHAYSKSSFVEKKTEKNILNTLWIGKKG